MVGEVLSTAFPVWVALGCFFGLVRPNSFNWVQPQMIIFGITITMLGMGMTLTFDDLRGALVMPKELLAGTASNIVTYLARGNVALSVLMTAASTLAAVVMTLLPLHLTYCFLSC
ncbi:hypothetical protein IFM89_000676 [Coptis chinensis]|uniref:Uncharacterized protein n=1 Tax=Coptis chinensis TaxID=261450 RepID=A0A835IKN1_9MAGN|nr:hypothetical protein IFM89_000676 [Coptis chinensis]